MDEAKAQKAIDFIGCLTHTKGELGLSSAGLARLGSLIAKGKKAEGIEEFLD